MPPQVKEGVSLDRYALGEENRGVTIAGREIDGADGDEQLVGVVRRPSSDERRPNDLDEDGLEEAVGAAVLRVHRGTQPKCANPSMRHCSGWKATNESRKSGTTKSSDAHNAHEQFKVVRVVGEVGRRSLIESVMMPTFWRALVMVSGFRNGTVLHLNLLQSDYGCLQSLPCRERLEVFCPRWLSLPGLRLRTCSFLPLRGSLLKLALRKHT